MTKNRIIVGLLLIFLTAAVVSLFFLPKPTRSVEQSAEERVRDVRVMEVEPALLREWVELPASVKPYLLTEISAEVDGRIDWIGPSEGDYIAQAGTPLARIDQRAFRAQLDDAQAAYTLAANNCKRVESLHKEGIMSNEQLDQCRATLASAVSQLEVAKIELEKATIRAPSAGILNKLYFDEGEYVRQGNKIADIVVIDPVKVVVKAPEKDIPSIRVGQKVSVSLDFLKNGEYEGVVTYISVIGDPGTRTYDVEITVQNPKREILPSMIARVKSLKREFPEAVTVPLFSVIPRGDYSMVFVEEGGRARERLVELGVLDGTRIQVVRGLEPGDRLIVEGQRELADGERVRVTGSPVSL